MNALLRGGRLVREASELGEMLQTYVRLALESGTPIERIGLYLMDVREAILLPRKDAR